MEKIFCLPGGFFHNGDCYREIKLHPPTGREIEILWSVQSCGSLAAAITILLTHCIDAIGDITEITPAIVRSLLVGDRDYLVLKLRQITFGNKVEATLVCPNPECEEKIDINFDTREIPIKQGKISSRFFTTKLPKKTAFKDDGGKNQYQVEFRLPNGGDQEELASLALKNETEAVNKLFSRCIRRIGRLTKIDESLVQKLSIPAREKIEKTMKELAPQVDPEMEAVCPGCNTVFPFPFNMAQFFLNEINMNLDQLYQEVHFLAFYYKWSEAEILAMTQKKRRKYLELLSDQLGRSQGG